MHGGAAPQVKAAAADRLEAARLQYLDMLEPALARLRGILGDVEATNPVLLRAIELIGDRTLGKVQDKLKLSGDASDPLEIVISRPAGDVPRLD